MKPLDVDKPLRVSKHVRNTWLRKWDWDMNQLREAMREAYEVEKVGKAKYEVYTRFGARRGKSRKLVVVERAEEVFVITASEAGVKR